MMDMEGRYVSYIICIDRYVRTYTIAGTVRV